MHVIGIVGGVASGKSTVSGMLRELGAVVLNADEAGHLVLREPDVIDALQNRWGIDVVQPDGQIDRAAVAARVFGRVSNARGELAFLESVTHPRIQNRLREQIETARAAGHIAVVLDAPLLFEGGWDNACDSILFVDAPMADRLKRIANRNWSEDELRKRESSQLPIQTKLQRADVVIQNNGALEETRQQIEDFWRKAIQGSAPNGAAAATE